MELTREQVRELDRRAIDEFGIPGIILMENAGRAVADEVARLYAAGGPAGPAREDAAVVILCGKGNNGGDGYVAARHLFNRGIVPSVFVCARLDEVSGDACVNLEIIRRMGVDVFEVTSERGLRFVEQAAARAAVIVDALLGTGAVGEARGLIRSGIEIINRASPPGGPRRPVVAVDLPSGLDANTGEVLGACVKADVTVTFVAPKRGFSRAQGPLHTGRVVIVEIGIPRQLLQP